MYKLNPTHDPGLHSWVRSANQAGTDFPIQNLPLASFRRRDAGESFRGGVAIGDQILDLAALQAAELLQGDAAVALARACAPTLNRLMALGPRYWSALRAAVSEALRDGSPPQSILAGALVAQADAEYRVPARIGDYTDFYTSLSHATRVGRLFRPDNPLLPNYKWVPIGYHGRSSSIGVSGQRCVRPLGQTRAADAESPGFGPCRRLDFELELGLYIGVGNSLGQPLSMADSDAQLFGLCLLNDWSARDIQAWEYQPLGPFLGKSFATTLSPWIVTLEALAPFRVPWTRGHQDPPPLPYLESGRNRAAGALDIQLEVLLQSARMVLDGVAPRRLSQCNFRHAYWTLAQLVVHHASNGCNLRPGDLLGSGTQSGPAEDQAGSLLELSQGGRQPIALGNGEQRTFLEDGDRVILRGWCERPGAVRIGFGAAAGRVEPAPPCSARQAGPPRG